MLEMSSFRLGVKQTGLCTKSAPLYFKGGALIFITALHIHKHSHTHSLYLHPSLSLSVPHMKAHACAHTRPTAAHSTSEQLIINISCELTLSQPSEPRLAKQHCSRSHPLSPVKAGTERARLPFRRKAIPLVRFHALRSLQMPKTCTPRGRNVPRNAVLLLKMWTRHLSVCLLLVWFQGGGADADDARSEMPTEEEEEEGETILRGEREGISLLLRRAV